MAGTKPGILIRRSVWSGVNPALSRWIETIYHLRTHGSTGMSPPHRFTGGAHPLRHVEEPNKIDPLFYTHTERVVRKDGTVPLKEEAEIDIGTVKQEIATPKKDSPTTHSEHLN